MGSVGSDKRTLTQEEFDSLLGWLDADREMAGSRYEDIRYRLIKIYRHRGCVEPEELADETINRVARKVKELSENYTGDPAHYFYGVAQNVFKEYLRSRRMPEVQLPSPPDDVEREYQCLDRCLHQLPPEKRELVLQYYEGKGAAKIIHRRELARREGVSPNTLRIRVLRIREALQDCITRCLTGISQGNLMSAVLQ